jgi:hypothetical protein
MVLNSLKPTLYFNVTILKSTVDDKNTLYLDIILNVASTIQWTEPIPEYIDILDAEIYNADDAVGSINGIGEIVLGGVKTIRFENWNKLYQPHYLVLSHTPGGDVSYEQVQVPDGLLSRYSFTAFPKPVAPTIKSLFNNPPNSDGIYDTSSNGVLIARDPDYTKMWVNLENFNKDICGNGIDNLIELEFYIAPYDVANDTKTLLVQVSGNGTKSAVIRKITTATVLDISNCSGFIKKNFTRINNVVTTNLDTEEYYLVLPGNKTADVSDNMYVYEAEKGKTKIANGAKVTRVDLSGNSTIVKINKPIVKDISNIDLEFFTPFPAGNTSLILPLTTFDSNNINGANSVIEDAEYIVACQSESSNSIDSDISINVNNKVKMVPTLNLTNQKYGFSSRINIVTNPTITNLNTDSILRTSFTPPSDAAEPLHRIDGYILTIGDMSSNVSANFNDVSFNLLYNDASFNEAFSGNRYNGPIINGNVAAITKIGNTAILYDGYDACGNNVVLDISYNINNALAQIGFQNTVKGVFSGRTFPVGTWFGITATGLKKNSFVREYGRTATFQNTSEIKMVAFPVATRVTVGKIVYNTISPLNDASFNTTGTLAATSDASGSTYIPVTITGKSGSFSFNKGASPSPVQIFLNNTELTTFDLSSNDYDTADTNQSVTFNAHLFLSDISNLGYTTGQNFTINAVIKDKFGNAVLSKPATLKQLDSNGDIRTTQNWAYCFQDFPNVAPSASLSNWYLSDPQNAVDYNYVKLTWASPNFKAYDYPTWITAGSYNPNDIVLDSLNNVHYSWLGGSPGNSGSNPSQDPVRWGVAVLDDKQFIKYYDASGNVLLNYDVSGNDRPLTNKDREATNSGLNDVFATNKALGTSVYAKLFSSTTDRNASANQLGVASSSRNLLLQSVGKVILPEGAPRTTSNVTLVGIGAVQNLTFANNDTAPGYPDNWLAQNPRFTLTWSAPMNNTVNSIAKSSNNTPAKSQFQTRPTNNFIVNYSVKPKGTPDASFVNISFNVSLPATSNNYKFVSSDYGANNIFTSWGNDVSFNVTPIDWYNQSGTVSTRRLNCPVDPPTSVYVVYNSPLSQYSSLSINVNGGTSTMYIDVSDVTLSTYNYQTSTFQNTVRLVLQGRDVSGVNYFSSNYAFGDNAEVTVYNQYTAIGGLTLNYLSKPTSTLTVSGTSESAVTNVKFIPSLGSVDKTPNDYRTFSFQYDLSANYSSFITVKIGDSPTPSTTFYFTDGSNNTNPLYKNISFDASSNATTKIFRTQSQFLGSANYVPYFWGNKIEVQVQPISQVTNNLGPMKTITMSKYNSPYKAWLDLDETDHSFESRKLKFQLVTTNVNTALTVGGSPAITNYNIILENLTQPSNSVVIPFNTLNYSGSWITSGELDAYNFVTSDISGQPNYFKFNWNDYIMLTFAPVIYINGVNMRNIGESGGSITHDARSPLTVTPQSNPTLDIVNPYIILKAPAWRWVAYSQEPWQFYINISDPSGNPGAGTVKFYYSYSPADLIDASTNVLIDTRKTSNIRYQQGNVNALSSLLTSNMRRLVITMAYAPDVGQFAFRKLESQTSLTYEGIGAPTINIAQTTLTFNTNDKDVNPVITADLSYNSYGTLRSSDAYLISVDYNNATYIYSGFGYTSGPSASVRQLSISNNKFITQDLSSNNANYLPYEWGKYGVNIKAFAVNQYNYVGSSDASANIPTRVAPVITLINASNESNPTVKFTTDVSSASYVYIYKNKDISGQEQGPFILNNNSAVNDFTIASGTTCKNASNSDVSLNYVFGDEISVFTHYKNSNNYLSVQSNVVAFPFTGTQLTMTKGTWSSDEVTKESATINTTLNGEVLNSITLFYVTGSNNAKNVRNFKINFKGKTTGHAVNVLDTTTNVPGLSIESIEVGGTTYTPGTAEYVNKLSDLEIVDFTLSQTVNVNGKALNNATMYIKFTTLTDPVTDGDADGLITYVAFAEDLGQNGFPGKPAYAGGIDPTE